MAPKYKVAFCLCVVFGGVAYAGYKLGHFADGFLFSTSWLLAETSSPTSRGTADFLVDAGSFAGNTTYFFVRDVARSSGKPLCVGGPYISDGPIKMQEAVWSKDGSVIAVRVRVGESAGQGFSRYDGAFWIDAYDFHTHRAIVEGVTLDARSRGIAHLLNQHGGVSSRTLTAPSVIGRSLNGLERQKFDTFDKDYRTLYNSVESIKK